MTTLTKTRESRALRTVRRPLGSLMLLVALVSAVPCGALQAQVPEIPIGPRETGNTNPTPPGSITIVPGRGLSVGGQGTGVDSEIPSGTNPGSTGPIVAPGINRGTNVQLNLPVQPNESSAPVASNPLVIPGNGSTVIRLPADNEDDVPSDDGGLVITNPVPTQACEVTDSGMCVPGGDAIPAPPVEFPPLVNPGTVLNCEVGASGACVTPGSDDEPGAAGSATPTGPVDGPTEPSTIVVGSTQPPTIVVGPSEPPPIVDGPTELPPPVVDPRSDPGPVVVSTNEDPEQLVTTGNPDESGPPATGSTAGNADNPVVRYPSETHTQWSDRDTGLARDLGSKSLKDAYSGGAYQRLYPSYFPANIADPRVITTQILNINQNRSLLSNPGDVVANGNLAGDDRGDQGGDRDDEEVPPGSVFISNDPLAQNGNGGNNGPMLMPDDDDEKGDDGGDQGGKKPLWRGPGNNTAGANGEGLGPTRTRQHCEYVLASRDFEVNYLVDASGITTESRTYELKDLMEYLESRKHEESTSTTSTTTTGVSMEADLSSLPGLGNLPGIKASAGSSTTSTETVSDSSTQSNTSSTTMTANWVYVQVVASGTFTVRRVYNFREQWNPEGDCDGSMMPKYSEYAAEGEPQEFSIVPMEYWYRDTYVRGLELRFDRRSLEEDFARKVETDLLNKLGDEPFDRDTGRRYPLESLPDPVNLPSPMQVW